MLYNVYKMYHFIHFWSMWAQVSPFLPYDRQHWLDIRRRLLYDTFKKKTLNSFNSFKKKETIYEKWKKGGFEISKKIDLLLMFYRCDWTSDANKRTECKLYF